MRMNREDLAQHFASEFEKLNEKQINAVYKRLQKWWPEAMELIDRSFLDPDRQNAYKKLIDERVKLFIA